MRPVDGGGASGGSAPPWTESSASIELPEPGETFNVEFWHVDQSMQMFINGEPVMEPLNYQWHPLERLQIAMGDPGETDVENLRMAEPLRPEIRWHFQGSPVTLHRVRLDRDLYYRTEDRLVKQPHSTPFGVHPEHNRAVLGPDQFMMCGDNSQSSLDSRLWGAPHRLVARQIDDAPFVVNRKLLLGKAWVVYFPAPFPIYKDGMPVVPDFGRLRFIR